MTRRVRRQRRNAPPPAARASLAQRLAAPPWPLLGLAALVLASFLPALWAGFVWDDVSLTTSAVVRDWDGLWRMWFAPGGAFDGSNLGDGKTAELHYWPLTYTSFWIEHKLWGYAPLGYHAVNLLLHCANTVLVWRLLARFGAPGAWFAAALFAVHPVHAEAVAWLFGRKDLLATLCYLGAFLAYARCVQAQGRRQALLYAAALALYAAAMLAKTIAVSLPAALLVWHWWQQGRIVRRDWLRTAPVFALGLGIALAEFAFYSGKLSTRFDYGIAERLSMAGQSLWFYAAKLLWPAPLPIIYPHWDVSAGNPLGYAAVLAALAVAPILWLLRRRIGRGPLAGALFFALALAPVLGFADNIFMRYSFVADRYQYLASAGAIAVFAGCAAVLARCLPKPAAAALAVAALAALGALSWQQSTLYKDDITYFSHIIRLNPDAAIAHGSLGVAYFNAGELERAAAAHRRAVELAPTFGGWMNLGQTLILLERLEEGLLATREAMQLRPQSFAATERAAEICRMLGRTGEAETLYRQALRIAPAGAPRLAETHSNLAVLLAMRGLLEEAEAHLVLALEVDPESDAARNNLATLRGRMRDER